MDVEFKVGDLVRFKDEERSYSIYHNCPHEFKIVWIRGSVVGWGHAYGCAVYSDCLELVAPTDGPW